MGTVSGGVGFVAGRKNNRSGVGADWEALILAILLGGSAHPPCRKVRDEGGAPGSICFSRRKNPWGAEVLRAGLRARIFGAGATLDDHLRRPIARKFYIHDVLFQIDLD